MSGARHDPRAQWSATELAAQANSASPTDIVGRLAEVDRRYKRNRRRRPRVTIATLRVRELTRLFTARYGQALPNDDAGREDAEIMAHHLARLSGDIRKRIAGWISLNAPWMGADELESLTVRVTGACNRSSADELAQLLGLTMAERTSLGITTIGAIDMSKRERTEARKERKRLATSAKRRAHGIRPRQEYLATALSRLKPWKADGISARTWYRRQKAKKSSGARLSQVCGQQ